MMTMTAASRMGPAFVASTSVAFLLASSAVDGHCHQQFPISRQYSRSQDFHDRSFENLEGAPYAFNAGGVQDVKDRARANTNKATLDRVGGGDLFPLYYLDHADNGNYLETNQVAKRTTPCGDPRLGFDEDEITYSTPNRQWEVLHTFESGQEIEIEATIVYYHWGHMEFFICDTGDLPNPDGVVNQECFNKYPLTRAYRAKDASVIDPSYPGRYYVDPPCRAGEVDQDVSDWLPDTADPYSIKMRYTLPDIECEHCVLQMHYLTGDRCHHIGYKEFDPPSWNSECAPTTDKWIYTDNRLCGLSQYPEEFWQCSDIALTRSAPSSPASPEQATDEAGTCSNGVKGIESSGGGACCVFECGLCGGDSCSTVGESLGLGAADCCEATVLANNQPCGEAPCVIAGEPQETPTTYEHLGCFRDDKEDRVLERADLDSADMTADVCFEFCADMGAAYMATQFGYECWCSSDVLLEYERHGDGAVCDRPCRGDENESCGGYDAFDLYKLHGTEEELGDPEYVGCFADDQDDRLMSHKTVIPGMTTAVCRDYCSDKGAFYYATQWSIECWCGTSDDETVYESHGPGKCNMSCDGDESITCGGLHSFSLFKYNTGRTPPTPTPTDAPTPEPIMPIAPPTGGDDCMVVIVEGEDLAARGDWNIVDDPDASGGKYIVWEGLSESRNNFDAEDGDIIAATIEVTTPGTYSFKWLMRQPSDVESDKANDSWLYFPDAARFGPAGTSQSYGTFVKVYGRAQSGIFQYSGTAEDENHRHTQIAVEFAEAGEYVMEIAGRSHGHQIDQIILFGDTLNVNVAAAGC